MADNLEIEKSVPKLDDATAKRYEQICQNIRALDENSFKLMGFVPLISGAAIIAVFLNQGLALRLGTVLVSVAGAAVTFGLYRWEFRNIQICKWLQQCADDIEQSFNVKKGREQFAYRLQDPRPKFDNPKWEALDKFHGIEIDQHSAETIIYATTIAAWLLLPVAVYFN